MKYNKTIFLAVLFHSNVLFSQVVPTGWFQLTSPVFSGLRSVTFLDSQTGYASGDSGVIIKTTNGGYNWFQQVSGTTKKLEKIIFTSSEIGYTIGELGLILKTSTGGNKWVEQISGTMSNLQSISFVSNEIGYACGLNNTLLKTTNGGDNWNTLSFLDPFNFYCVTFLNSQTGWLSGGTMFFDSLQLLKTTNGGINWIIKYNLKGVSSPLLSLQFTDSLHGITIYLGSVIDVSFTVKTIDGGSIWTQQSVVGYAGRYTMYFKNERMGWAAGSLNRMARTTNGGANWISSVAFPVSNEFYSIYFIDTLTGWAVGNGVILKTTTGGILTGFSNASSEIPVEYFLSQNFPNPFNPVTNLGFGISELGFVSLKVYDVLGNEVSILVNETKAAGNYNYQFSTVNYQLSSGVYFYRLEVDGVLIDTKRMVLLK